MHELDDLKNRQRLLARKLYAARHAVFFTGAGISTESGLPDYRGPDGVWTRRDKGLAPPRSTPFESARPNRSHKALQELYELDKLGFLISQNVDNLHRRSGIPENRLVELHGNVARLRCSQCGRRVERDRGLTACQCGGRFEDSVVHFGQPLPEEDLRLAFEHSRRSDLFVVLGSSLTVTPAADMPQQALRNGADLVIVNQQATPLDRWAVLRFQEPIGEVLTRTVKQLKGFMGLYD